MLPYSYNSNYQLMQTGDAFVVHAEMIHDARIIRLDGRPHLTPDIRLWMGDSIGRWEGDTLVVDTTNFNDGGGFYGDAGGNFGGTESSRRRAFLFLASTAASTGSRSTTPSPSPKLERERPWRGRRADLRVRLPRNATTLSNLLMWFPLTERQPHPAALICGA